MFVCGTAAHHQLVNDYNSVKPLPVGYAVKTTDDCDIFVTTVFQREGLSGLIGRECGVERHIQIFKRLGIWNEDGTTTKSRGHHHFNWIKIASKIMVLRITSELLRATQMGIIHTIEGNSNNQVRRNTYRIGHGNIRGFLQPHVINNKKKPVASFSLSILFETLEKADLDGFKG